MKRIIPFLILIGCSLNLWAQSGPAIDPRKGGRHDDGTDEGAINAKIVEGNIVFKKFKNLATLEREVAASTSVMSYQAGAVFDNPNRSGTGWFIQVPQLTESQISTGGFAGVIVTVPFYGRDFWLSVKRGTDAGTRDFGVDVDQWTKKVHPVFDFVKDRGLSDPGDVESRIPVFTGLPESHHIARIFFDASASVASSWFLYGYGVEARAGNEPEREVAAPGTPVLLSSTNAVSLNAQNFAAYSYISLHNESAGAAIVTNVINSVVGEMFYLAANGTQGDTYRISWPIPILPTGAASAWQLWANTNAVVRATVYGTFR